MSLPYISNTLNVVRHLHKLEITARHTSGEDLVTFTCWLGQQACVVGVSGWLHADTKGLLGNFNLNPADDFMRPGGKVGDTLLYVFYFIFYLFYISMSKSNSALHNTI